MVYLRIKCYGILLTFFTNACKAILLIALNGVTLMNNEFFFECILKMKFFEAQAREKSPVRFIAPDMACNVSNWKHCDSPFPVNPLDGHCGCIYKKGYPVLEYRFVFYRSKMGQVAPGTFYYCKLDKDLDERRLIEVKGFTRTPGPVATVCEGTNLTLNWVFPLTFDFKAVFTVREVIWKLQDTEIGKCIYKEGSTSRCSRKADREFDIITTLNNDIPKLIYYNVPKEVGNSILSISMTFSVTGERKDDSNSTEDSLEGVRKRQAAYDVDDVIDQGTEVNNGDLSRGDLFNLGLGSSSDPRDQDGRTSYGLLNSTTSFQTTPERPFTEFSDGTTTGEYSSTTPETFSSTRMTTKPAGRSTTPKLTQRITARVTTTPTTTPKPVNVDVKKKIFHILDSTKLSILEPPSESMNLEFSGTKTFTGQIIVSCEISKASELGEPPVNLSIWHNAKLIISREASHLLRYMITVAQGNLTCGINGESANCLGEAFRESQKQVLDVREIQSKEEEDTSLNFNLFMYLVETISCMILMTWTVTLILDHLRTLMTRQRHIIELQLMVMLSENRYDDDDDDDLPYDY